jgi:hypothetical protein
MKANELKQYFRDTFITMASTKFKALNSNSYLTKTTEFENEIRLELQLTVTGEHVQWNAQRTTHHLLYINSYSLIN